MNFERKNPLFFGVFLPNFYGLIILCKTNSHHAPLAHKRAGGRGAARSLSHPHCLECFFDFGFEGFAAVDEFLEKLFSNFFTTNAVKQI